MIKNIRGFLTGSSKKSKNRKNCITREVQFTNSVGDGSTSFAFQSHRHSKPDTDLEKSLLKFRVNMQDVQSSFFSCLLILAVRFFGIFHQFRMHTALKAFQSSIRIFHRFISLLSCRRATPVNLSPS